MIIDGMTATHRNEYFRNLLEHQRLTLESVTEQRDRLAEALQRVRDGYGGQVASPNCCEDCDFLIPIDKALQSLTTNEL